MKALKWGAAITVALIILLALALTLAVQKRQAAVSAFGLKDLAALRLVELNEEGAVTAFVVPEEEDQDARENPDVPEPLPRLEAPPTISDARAEHALEGVAERAACTVYLAGLKRVESAFWLAGGPFEKQVTDEIGYQAFRLGDTDAARLYLREALRAADPGLGRERVCGQLAWLEKDPEIATALLHASCAGKDPHNLLMAVRLAEVTGSEDLAAYYADRCAEVLGRDAVARTAE